MRLTHDQVRRLQEQNERLEDSIGLLIVQNDNLEERVTYLTNLAAAILVQAGGRVELNDVDLAEAGERVFVAFDLVNMVTVATNDESDYEEIILGSVLGEEEAIDPDVIEATTLDPETVEYELAQEEEVRDEVSLLEEESFDLADEVDISYPEEE